MPEGIYYTYVLRYSRLPHSTIIIYHTEVYKFTHIECMIMHLLYVGHSL